MHADHLSSATRITDAAGLEVRRLAYTSFGEAAENQGSGDGPKYTYTGKEHDASGLYYYGARYYDPVLARFISADTVYDAGPQGLNRYAYALNNPIRYRDPSGYASQEWETWEEELKQHVEQRFTEIHPYDLTQDRKEAITLEEVRKLRHKYRLLYYQTRDYDPKLAILDPLYQQEIAEHGIKNKKVRAFIQGFLIGFGIGLQIAAQDALTEEALKTSDSIKDDLAAYRKRMGMPEAGSLEDAHTAARLDIGGKSFYGQNAHDLEVDIRVNPQTKTHAEAHVFQQAKNAGVSSKTAILYVDRDLCTSCGDLGGVGSLMRGTGVDELIVVSPSGRYRITSSRPSVPEKID